MKDSLGRENRTVPDRRCDECGKVYRPRRDGSRYCSRPCMWANNGGANRKAETWWVNGKGYVEGKVWVNGRQVRVKQHRWVMEATLGRPLARDEHVHHRNGDKTDNRPENLELVAPGAHSHHHNSERVYRRGYKLDLSPEERARRSARMSELRRTGRI